MSTQIHTLADIQSAQLCPNACIVADFNNCSHVLVENDVIIGDRVTIKSGEKLRDGLRLEDDVFVGPNVTYTNDGYPRSRHYPESFPVTTIQRGALIGEGRLFRRASRLGSGPSLAPERW